MITVQIRNERRKLWKTESIIPKSDFRKGDYVDITVRTDAFIGFRRTGILRGGSIAVIIRHIIIQKRGRDVFHSRKSINYLQKIQQQTLNKTMTGRGCLLNKQDRMINNLPGYCRTYLFAGPGMELKRMIRK